MSVDFTIVICSSMKRQTDRSTPRLFYNHIVGYNMFEFMKTNLMINKMQRTDSLVIMNKEAVR